MVPGSVVKRFCSLRLPVPARICNLLTETAASPAAQPAAGCRANSGFAENATASDDASIPQNVFDRMVPREQRRTRLLQAALVGRPNAGKSELTNKLAGIKVTAVSSKCNTTIRPHLGAFTDGSTQVVLFDTPGIIGSRDQKYQGQENRVREAWSSALACDLIVLIVDAFSQFEHSTQSVYNLASQLSERLASSDWSAAEPSGSEQATAAMPPPAPQAPADSFVADSPASLTNAPLQQTHEQELQPPRPRLVLVLNKIDKLPPVTRQQAVRLLEDKFRELAQFEPAVFPMAAVRNEGVDALRRYLVSQAREGEWLLPERRATDKSPEEMALELVREKLFKRLNKEVPYLLQPHHVKSYQLRDGVLRIQQVVPVDSLALKRMVIGERGAVIQEYVIAKTEQELERLYKRRIRLDVSVQLTKR